MDQHNDDSYRNVTLAQVKKYIILSSGTFSNYSKHE